MPTKKTLYIRKERLTKLWGWVKKTITHTRLEVIIASIALFISAKSLQSSNKALSLTRIQFENSNRPFLQVQNNSDTLQYSIGKPVTFSFRLKNLGNYPVKILGRALALRFSDEKLEFENFSVNKFISSPEYVNDVSMPIDLKSREITQALYDSLKLHKKDIYILTVIKYKNLLTDELNKFELLLRIGSRNLEVLRNENYTFKETIK